MRYWVTLIVVLMCFLFCFPFSTSAQTNPNPPSSQANVDALKKSAPRVFIDCDYVDLDYIKTEITFVNYVRDRKEAQVHVLITLQSTGSRGVEYTMSFSGQQDFQGMDDIQKFVSNKTQTKDEIRQGLVRVLKMGLIRYVAKTPISEKVSIVFQEKASPTAVVDKWNFWVFSLSARAYLNGQKSTDSNYFYGTFSANRTTPEWKIRLGLSAASYKDSFSYLDQTISSLSDSKSFSAMVVKSFGEHWSIGAYLSAISSTYSNIKFSLSPAPAIEYNLFPYSQSSRRFLSFVYRLNFQTVKYYEETIYDKTSENLWSQTLSVILDLKEKWGSISTSLEGSNYFHNFQRNHLSLYGSVSLRIWKGLALDVSGYYSMIHDQLSLQKGQASLDDVLLRRTLLETDYQYYLSIGISYTFGSIFTNVVNPRFGGSGYSGRSFY
jgi:hypothetical protein